MNIAFFGGSFDPIHYGHINLALEILELQGLDKICLCPAKISPLKNFSPRSSGEDRLNMVQLATEDIPKLAVLDREIHREGPSYTIDTLESLIAEDELKKIKNNYFLILSDDLLPNIHLWHRIEDIIQNFNLLIGTRQPHKDLSIANTKILEAVQKGLCQTSIWEISSTEIRERIEKGLYCGHLLPKKVLDYIHANHLY